MSVLNMFANVASAAVPTDEDKTPETSVTGTGTGAVTGTKTDNVYTFNENDINNDVNDPTGVTGQLGLKNVSAFDDKGQLVTRQEFQNRINQQKQALNLKAPVYVDPETKEIGLQGILDKYTQNNAEEDEKERKLAHSRATMSAIGDGLNAIFNLIGTMNGKKNYVSDDPSKTLSGQNLARYEKYLADTKQARKEYADLQLRAAALQSQENNRKISNAMNRYSKDMNSFNTSVKAVENWEKANWDNFNNASKDIQHKQEQDALNKYRGNKLTIDNKRANKSGKGGSKTEREATTTEYYKGYELHGTIDQIRAAKKKIDQKDKDLSSVFGN